MEKVRGGGNVQIFVPSYYQNFRCIAGNCLHTCCVGWEIDVDEESLPRFAADPLVSPHLETGNPPHIRLLPGERCPFLRSDGLCEMILQNGEQSLCQICRDHPRFRNYWSTRVEIGLGLVCEEAARLILSETEPMALVPLGNDKNKETQPDDAERWLFDLRSDLLSGITETGPRARLLEYLIFRHLGNALYDDRVEERLAFIETAFAEITAQWDKTDGSLAAIAEVARAWSYDVEYDDEALEMRLKG